MAGGTPSDIIKILAYRTKGGNRIAKLAATRYDTPIFPAGLTVSYELRPIAGTYASILFSHRMAPETPPGVFLYETSHAGYSVQMGLLYRGDTDIQHEAWIEITNDYPVVAKLTNTSALAHTFIASEAYMMVSTVEDMQVIRDIVGGRI